MYALIEKLLKYFINMPYSLKFMCIANLTQISGFFHLLEFKLTSFFVVFLNSRPKGYRFEPHRRHCVVSLSKIINPSLVLVQPRKTRPFITERLLMGGIESNQTKQNKFLLYLNDNLLYFNCLPDVLWLLVFCDSSSWYCELVSSI